VTSLANKTIVTHSKMRV